jgi:60S ribosomal subunit assembly/export protein LOC1
LSLKISKMAPRPPTGARGSSKSAKPKSGLKGSTATSSKPKPKPAAKRPPPQQVKTKPGTHNPVKPKKKKQRVYTDKELGLPALNMITPAGVQKPKGKKKGKIFVDDRESMMTILAMVNAEKEGQIESKIVKARKMEEIREARRKEAEARHEKKNEKLEETKKSFKKKKPTKTGSRDDIKQASSKNGQSVAKNSEKKVSFA